MSPSPDSPERHVRVLVVDDEPTLRLGFAYALSNRGNTVETAANGRAALQRMEADPFDIVILDLRMPELDGLGVIEALRIRGNRTPVVLCSAALTAASALRAIRRGVVDFLLKPVLPDDLRGVIRAVLQPGTSSLERALQQARKGSVSEALRILEEEDPDDPRAYCWKEVFRHLGEDSDSSQAEELIRTGMADLAFRATHST